MRFPTTILQIFSKHDGSQDLSDSIVEVPRSLLPVVTIPEPTRLLVGGTLSPDINSTSFALDTQVEATNGGGNIDQPIFILSPGIWDVVINWMVSSNFSDYAKAAGIYFKQVGTTNTSQLITWQPINSSQTGRIYHRIVHDFAQGMELRYYINDPTAVGNKMALNLGQWMNRLG